MSVSILPNPTSFAAVLALIGLVVGMFDPGSSGAQLPSRPASLSATGPFTVRDSIELQKLTGATNDEGSPVLFSPASSKFLVRASRGLIEENALEETLLIYSTREVSKFLDHERHGVAPAPETLLVERFYFAQSPGGHTKLTDIRWLNETTVGFIAPDSSGVDQGFVVDVRDKQPRQVTHSGTDVLSFDTVANTTIYWAKAEEPISPVVEIQGRSLYDIFEPQAEAFPHVRLFVEQGPEGAPKLIKESEARMGLGSLALWLAPTGRYAVALFPSVNSPVEWGYYAIDSGNGLAVYYTYDTPHRTSDPLSAMLWWRTRYVLVDISKFEMAPLTESPTGIGVFLNGEHPLRTPVGAVWLGGDDSVIVSNMFLPSETVNDHGPAIQHQLPVIAEVETRTRRVEPLSTIQVRLASGDIGQAVGFVAGGDSKIDISFKSLAGRFVTRRFIKGQQRWVAANRANAQPVQSVAVEKRESLNERPRLVATGGSCRCTRELWDPAPTASRFSFGHTQLLTWTDKNGTVWHGGLLTPPSYVKSRTYPLVVQTHGFNDHEFLIDGPHGYTTAMAAQPLANRGIIVLQVEENPRAYTLDEREARLTAEGWRAGIQSIVDRGIVDRNRIGLIAFSRSGLAVVRLLADHPNLLTAVNIADGAWWGYMNDLLQENTDATDADVTGGVVGLQDPSKWIAANPLYLAAKARAAVRLEAHGSMSLLGHWEFYALRQRAKSAVDFVYFPFGAHVLERPTERLASQGESVDWFDFWLTGHEDPGPSKTAQYHRWERECDEQLARLPDDVLFCARSRR